MTKSWRSRCRAWWRFWMAASRAMNMSAYRVGPDISRSCSMSVIWQKVWFDLWHNKVRTLLSVLSITAGVFAIGAIFGMSDTMLNGMDTAHQSVAPSHINLFLTGLIT